MAALAFSSCGEWGLLFFLALGLLIADASVLWSMGCRARGLQELWI